MSEEAEELKCHSSSDSKGSNGGQDQLEDLHNTVEAVKDITKGFRRRFREENSRLASLIDHVNIILTRNSCSNSGVGEGKDASGRAGISCSSPNVWAEVELLKDSLEAIKLQVRAFRALKEENGPLDSLLQTLDEIIPLHPVLPPSFRIKKCHSSSDSKGSNGGQDQLEDLHNTVEAVKDIIKGFRRRYRGENSRLTSLIDHVNIILTRNSCSNSGVGEGKDASGRAGISCSSPNVWAEVELLKDSLKAIKLQVPAFRELKEENGPLDLLLLNLDKFIPDLPDSTFDNERENDVVTAAADRINNHNLNPQSISTGKDVEMPTCGSFLSPSTSKNRKRKTDRNMTLGSGANTAFKTAKVVTEVGRLPVSTRPSPPNSRKESHFDSDSDSDVTFLNFIPNKVHLSKIKIEVDHNPSGRNQNGALIKEEKSNDAASDNDVERNDNSSLGSTTSKNRKRKTDRNMTLESGANTAFKTAKVVTEVGRLPVSTRPSPLNSRKESHFGSDSESDSDCDVTFLNFIPSKVNLSKVKIEVDHNPSCRNQNGALIKEEKSDDAASDSEVEMSDNLSLGRNQESSETSSDAEVNSGEDAEVTEEVQVQDIVALNSPDGAVPDDQNSDNIFEQKEILTAIFENLHVNTLKNVRLVSKQWKKIADARLIQEKRWKLVIDNKFRKRYRGKTLDDLNDCIANAKEGFPLTTLIFGNIASQCNDYTKPELLRFYDLHGTKITSLILRDFRCSAGALHDLLLNSLPNIENIYIGTIWLTTNEKLLTSSNSQELIMLPKLKTIRFSLNTDPRNKAHEAIFKAFLASAVNLEEIENVRSHMLPCIAQAGKLDCVKHFKFFPKIFIKAHSETSWPHRKVSRFEQPTDRTSFEKLCELQPKLSTLKIHVLTLKSRELLPQYVKGLNQILESSKGSLVRLQIPCFFFTPDLVFPKLKNLDHLDIHNSFLTRDLEPPAIFPGSLNIGETFPNVRIFSCDLVGIANETDWISKYFPDGNNSNEGEIGSPVTFKFSRSFPSVTLLEFQHHYSFGKALELYFPMLTEIVCYRFDVTSRKSGHMGANCGLRETTIGVKSLELWGFRLSGEESRLDELFTGISKLECEKLNDSETHSTAQAGNHLFQNLKSLRRLKIVCDHFDNSKLKPSSVLPSSGSLYDEPVASAVITPVSYRYAFALMENLEELCFAYDHNLPAASDFAKIFKPFATYPCVKIVHEPNQSTAA